MKKYILKFLLIFASFSSCENDDDNYIHPNLGDYKLLTLTSDIPLDLNYDNLQSTNFKDELSVYYNGSRNAQHALQLVDFYGNNQWFFYLGSIPRDFYSDLLEILELRYATGDYSKSIFVNDNIVTEIRHTYSDLFVADSTWLVNNKYPYPYEVVFINDSTTSVKVIQKYFDIATDQWVDVNLVGVFEKK